MIRLSGKVGTLCPLQGFQCSKSIQSAQPMQQICVNVTFAISVNLTNLLFLLSPLSQLKLSYQGFL